MVCTYSPIEHALWMSSECQVNPLSHQHWVFSNVSPRLLYLSLMFHSRPCPASTPPLSYVSHCRLVPRCYPWPHLLKTSSEKSLSRYTLLDLNHQPPLHLLLSVTSMTPLLDSVMLARACIECKISPPHMAIKLRKLIYILQTSRWKYVPLSWDTTLVFENGLCSSPPLTISERPFSLSPSGIFYHHASLLGSILPPRLRYASEAQLATVIEGIGWVG